MTENPDNVRHPFSSDRPIATEAEDTLGRTAFARALGNAVRAWKGKDSLVVAVYGNWGSGKSSVLNLMTDFLVKQKEQQPLIAYFNPWQLSGDDQVVASFFHEVGWAIGEASADEDKQRNVSAWVKYGAFLELSGPLLVLAMTSGSPNSLALAAAVTNLPLVGKAVSKLAKAFRSKDEPIAQTLKKRKDILREHLSGLKETVVIVIDDIDRLNRQEIALVLRLVKANADFPNLVFVLAFDRHVVAAALTEEPYFSGEQYLEKVIQVGFNLPTIEPASLETILLPGIRNRLNVDSAHEMTAQELRFQKVFHNCIRKYFKNPRQVNRYLGMLEFHFQIHSTTGKTEVDKTDLALLEAIRLIEPKVYEKMSASMTLLTAGKGSFLDISLDNVKAQVEELVNLATAENRSLIKNSIIELFPNAEWALDGTTWSGHYKSEWLSDLRVAHENNFRRYFQLSIPANDISEAETTNLLLASGEKEQFTSLLFELNERGLLQIALDRFETKLATVSPANRSNVLASFFKVAERVESRDGVLRLHGRGDVVLKLRFIIIDLLKLCSDADEIQSTLRESIQGTDGLYLSSYILHTQVLANQDPQYYGNPLLTLEQLRPLQELWMRRVSAAAASDSLLRSPGLSFVVSRWREWGGELQARDWLASRLGKVETLPTVLAGFLHYTTITAGDSVKVMYKIDLSEIEPLTDLEEIAKNVRQVNAENLQGLERIALPTYLKAMQRKAEGKSYEDWRWDDEN